jgi:hypothetical protein
LQHETYCDGSLLELHLRCQWRSQSAHKIGLAVEIGRITADTGKCSGSVPQNIRRLICQPIELRPAGYESASHSKETNEAAVVYGTSDSSVAPEVAFGTPDLSRKSLMSGDDVGRLIEVLPSDLTSVVRAWPRLPVSLRQAVLAIVENTSDE